MEITTSFLTKKFNEFNAKYFNGEIPMVNFTFSNTRNNLGMYFSRTHTIRITKYYKNITEHDVEEILIHEMVHAWQHKTNHREVGRNRSHGPRFYAKANTINNQSNGYFHISRCTTLSEETKKGVKARVTNNHPLIVCKKNNSDTYHVGKVTEVGLADFMRWLPRYYDSVEAFYISDDIAPLFADYVISRSRFNYKLMNKDMFEQSVVPNMQKIQVLSTRW